MADSRVELNPEDGVCTRAWRLPFEVLESPWTGKYGRRVESKGNRWISNGKRGAVSETVYGYAGGVRL